MRTEDLLWKKKSTKIFKYVMLFFIRLAEVLTASIIPSIMGIVILYINPKPRVMQTLMSMSMIIFAIFSCTFWVRYVKHRNKVREFYIMNGIVYALYITFSALIYISADAYMYTIAFSNLRGLELFGCKTLTSMIAVHCGMLVAMYVSERIARIFYRNRYEKIEENRADEIEIDEKDEIPKQANEEVKILTVDEVNLEYDRDIDEATETAQNNKEYDSDAPWSGEMVQGDGKKVTNVIPDDIDNDIDDSDYYSEAYARAEMQDIDDYESDSLWNVEIYKGKEPVYEYEDEESEQEMLENDDSWGEDDKLFNVEGGVEYDYDDKNEYDDYDDAEEYGANSFADYDADNLWGEIKQGK